MATLFQDYWDIPARYKWTCSTRCIYHGWERDVSIKVVWSRALDEHSKIRRHDIALDLFAAQTKESRTS